MQKAGFCYKESWKKEGCRKGWSLGLLPNGLHSPGEFRHQFLSEPGGSFSRGALCRRLPALLNRRLETCQKNLARLASIEVLFQFITQRIVQLLIQIVREFSEHCLTAHRFRFIGNGALWHNATDVATRPRLQGFHEFLSDEQPGA